MKKILRTEIGRGLTGALITIGITLAIIFPVVFMQLFSLLLNLPY